MTGKAQVNKTQRNSGGGRCAAIMYHDIQRSTSVMHECLKRRNVAPLNTDDANSDLDKRTNAKARKLSNSVYT